MSPQRRHMVADFACTSEAPRLSSGLFAEAVARDLRSLRNFTGSDGRKAFEMGSRNQRDLVIQETQAGNELIALRDFFKLNAEIARKAADKTGNEIGHGVHTGEACAFEVAAGYIDLALGRLGY